MRRSFLGFGALSIGALSVSGLVTSCGGDGEAAKPPSSLQAPPEAGTELDAGGRPDAGPPLPTAKGDPCRGVALPAGSHHAPQGTCTRIVASGISGLRQITFAPDGDLFAASNDGKIWRLHDANDDGVFSSDEIAQYATTGGNGNNCHIEGGFLYAGSVAGVKRFTYAPGATSGGAGEDVIVDQPQGGHAKHTVHVYNGNLYVHSGSAGNATNPNAPEYDHERSLIKRFSLASFKPGTPLPWASGEVVTVGLRNANGFTRNARGKIFAVVNGLDDQRYAGQDVHDDNPGEEIVEIVKGAAHGYPFCFTAQRIVVDGKVIPPGTQLANPGFSPGHDDAWCATNSRRPATFVQAHSAPLDLTFFDDAPVGGLPERWRGGAFVALHGSWNRTPPTGYKVVWVPFDEDGNAPMPESTTTATTFPYETVFGGGNASGAVDGPWKVDVPPFADQPRPAGVAISPVDGALYVATDSGGMLYRVGLAK